MRASDGGIPDWDRARLARGLREGDPHALTAFYAHFRPILAEHAQRFGIPDADRADAVETFLGDMLLRLCSAAELPKSLHGYVFISFKRYVSRIGSANAAGRNAMEEFRASAAQSAPGLADDTPANDSLSRFASALLAELTSEERLILGAKAEEMPLREIAALLGVNYSAANTRLCRLRSRLRTGAHAVVARMQLTDRVVVERFLRRAAQDHRSATAHHASPEAQNEVSRRLNNG